MWRGYLIFSMWYKGNSAFEKKKKIKDPDYGFLQNVERTVESTSLELL